jgi:hypothetical protein
MNAQSGIRTAHAIVSGTAAETLDAVTRAGVAAAVWRRRLEPAFARAIDHHPAGAFSALRITVPLPAIGGAVEGWARAAGLAEEVAAFLGADAAALAARFARLLSSDRLALRIDVLDGNACGRFHVDRMGARLLCTWRGPGTEFAVPGPDGTPLPVGRLPTGAAAVLRGTLWPGHEATALLHRSPPIAGTGTTRLLLVLDPADACACC